MPDQPKHGSPGTAPERFGDPAAVAVFLVLLAAVLAYWFRHDSWLSEYDILSYFLPWYGEVGDRLRDREIPGWMPWLAAGSPLAGDPSGGWWYVPVMLSFTLLPLLAAFKGMILIQTLVGGLATYAFARRIGQRPVAALTSTCAYVFGTFLASQMAYGTVAGQASAWIPVAFLGVESSLHARRWFQLVAWWGVAGVGISQLAVSWPGQGLYNGLLLIAAWVAYRGLVWPVNPQRAWSDRLLDTVVTGPAVVVLGLMLAAAGLLPRLEASSAANIRNGDYEGIRGGDYLAHPHSLGSLLRDTFVDSAHNRPVGITGSVFVLAVLAVILCRRRSAMPFFAAVAVLAGLLTMDDTPLQRVMALLPSFEVLHDHSPRRLLWVCFLAPAMLAGAGLDALLDWRPRRRALPLVGVPLALMLGITAIVDHDGFWIGWWPLGLTVATTAVVLALVGMQGGALRDGAGRLAPIGVTLLLLLVVAYPTVVDIVKDGIGESEEEEAVQSCLATATARSDPGGAGEFLHTQAASAPPFRYVIDAGRDPSTSDPSYSYRRCDPEVLAVLSGGRAVRLDLQSIQGYNPLHLAAYATYIDTMNGGDQDYHWTDPYPAALVSSPLIDMLNVRYIVVALGVGQEDAIQAMIGAGKREVFRNDELVILENPAAFPRAWIVHDVRQEPQGEGLAQLANGSVDGRAVAFVEGPLPAVAPPAAGATEGVTITDWQPESLTATVEAGSAGLVVFSEIHAPGWVATVDGERVEVLQVNTAFRGVPVPQGTHTIELTYEPRSLRLGLWVSSLSGIGLVGIGAVAIGQWAGDRRRIGISA